MKTEYTKNELTNKVSTFYNGYLDLNKALKLFEIEYGFVPTIIERPNLINQKFCDAQNYPDFINPESLTYMKDLQESGVVNMFMATGHIQAALLLGREEARELLTTYMKDYQDIYYPEQAL